MRKSQARKNIHLWRDHKYHTSAQGVPLCSCCHVRPRQFTHAIYPHLCKKCYDTRVFKKEEDVAQIMLADAKTLQRQWLAMGATERESVLAKLRGMKGNDAAHTRMRIQKIEDSKFERKLDPRLSRLFNKQETGK